MLANDRIQFLKDCAREARIETINMISRVGRGHYGGAMSIIETLVYLYYEEMKIDPMHPSMPDRDRLVISKGHAAPAIYSILAMKGYFERERLLTLNANGTSLPSHCDMKKVPGIDMTAGSLGQGLSAAVGMAIAYKLDGKSGNIFAIVGDGESQEGQIWEAVMFASHKKLDNLIVFVDDNGCQVDDRTDNINKLRPFKGKYEAFGWDAYYVEDGHSFEQIHDAVQLAKCQPDKPHAIILNTIKAKSIFGIENEFPSHCFSMTDEQLEKTLSNLR